MVFHNQTGGTVGLAEATLPYALKRKEDAPQAPQLAMEEERSQYLEEEGSVGSPRRGADHSRADLGKLN